MMTLYGVCRFDVVGDVRTDTPYRTLEMFFDRFGQDLRAAG